MRINEILSKEIDPEAIHSAHLRNEITTFLELARVGIGLESRPKWQEAYRRKPVIPPRPFVQRIVFVDIPGANAFAFKADDCSTIAITTAIPLITRAFFVGALAEDGVLGDMRDVHYLSTPYKSSGACDWASLAEMANAFSLEKLYSWAKSVPRLPQTDDRSGRGDLAIVLSMQAWSFIVFHELGHHAMLHLETSGTSPESLAYAEVEDLVSSTITSKKQVDQAALNSNADSDLPEKLLFRHANELEADRYAIAKMYSKFFRLHETIAAKSSNYRAIARMSERSRTRLWLVTIGLVFLLFEVAGRRRSANTHPRPLFRLQELFESTLTANAAISSVGSKNHTIFRWFVQGFSGKQEAMMDEFNRGYDDAKRDLTLIAHKLGIHNPYAIQPDDATYQEHMMNIRLSRPRNFPDDALT